MSVFKFKQFEVNQTMSAMKIGTDAMLFGALIDSAGKKNALDIGTGTGVLSLMVAQKNPRIQIKAIEIEEIAFHEAKDNFKNSVFHHQLGAIHGDLKDFNPKERFDLIFTNPPYFTNSSKSVSQTRNIARHTDTLSLQELASKVSELVTDDGDIWVILPEEQMQLLTNKMKNLNFFANEKILIFGKSNQIVRQIICFSKIYKQIVQRELVIRDQNNQYTEEYKRLTSEYHFNKL